MIFFLNFFNNCNDIRQGNSRKFFDKIERLYENLESETEMSMVKPMYLELKLEHFPVWETSNNFACNL